MILVDLLHEGVFKISYNEHKALEARRLTAKHLNYICQGYSPEESRVAILSTYISTVHISCQYDLTKIKRFCKEKLLIIYIYN